MNNETVTPATQVHIANEMLTTALGPNGTAIGYPEARMWLEVLFGYAKVGASLRAAHWESEQAEISFGEACNELGNNLRLCKEGENNGAD